MRRSIPLPHRARRSRSPSERRARCGSSARAPTSRRRQRHAQPRRARSPRSKSRSSPRKKSPRPVGPSKKELRRATQEEQGVQIATFEGEPDLTVDASAAKRRGGSLQDALKSRTRTDGVPPWIGYAVLALLVGGAVLFLLLPVMRLDLFSLLALSACASVDPAPSQSGRGHLRLPGGALRNHHQRRAPGSGVHRPGRDPRAPLRRAGGRPSSWCCA